MRKQERFFSFSYPLQQKTVRNMKIVTEHVGMLEVEGMGYFNPEASVLDMYERFDVDIDFVRWQGTDIRSVLEVTGGMDEIRDAAIRHFARQSEFGRAA